MKKELSSYYDFSFNQYDIAAETAKYIVQKVKENSIYDLGLIIKEVLEKWPNRACGNSVGDFKDPTKQTPIIGTKFELEALLKELYSSISLFNRSSKYITWGWGDDTFIKDMAISITHSLWLSSARHRDDVEQFAKPEDPKKQAVEIVEGPKTEPVIFDYRTGKTNLVGVEYEPIPIPIESVTSETPSNSSVFST